jgi:hypothetical protein
MTLRAVAAHPSSHPASCRADQRPDHVSPAEAIRLLPNPQRDQAELEPDPLDLCRARVLHRPVEKNRVRERRARSSLCGPQQGFGDGRSGSVLARQLRDDAANARTHSVTEMPSSATSIRPINSRRMRARPPAVDAKV